MSVHNRLVFFLFGSLSFLFCETYSVDLTSYQNIEYIRKSIEISSSVDLGGSLMDIEEEKADLDLDLEINGRLLKGDLKALLNRINSESLRYSGYRFEILAHLDLYNSERDEDKFNFNKDTTSSEFRALLYNYSTLSLNSSVERRKYKKEDGFFRSLDLGFSLGVNEFVSNHNGFIQNDFVRKLYNLSRYEHFDRVDYDTSLTKLHGLDSSNIGVYQRYENHENNLLSIAPTLSLGLGYGRTHDVTYHAVALHTFEFLKKAGLLLKEDKSSLLKLAQLYEELKQERILDGRETRIRQMTKICSWLEDEKISKPLSSYHTMVLLDQWEYGFLQHRSKGKILSLQAKSVGTYGKLISETTRNYSSFDTTMSINSIPDDDVIKSWLPVEADTIFSTEEWIAISQMGPKLQFTYEKPIGLKKMLSISSYINGGMQFNKSDTALLWLSQYFASNIRVEYILFPTLRSELGFSLSSSYHKSYCNDEKNDFLNYNFFAENLGVDFSFYISPRFSIDAAFDQDFYYQKNESILDEQRFENDVDLSLGFTYKFL